MASQLVKNPQSVYSSHFSDLLSKPSILHYSSKLVIRGMCHQGLHGGLEEYLISVCVCRVLDVGNIRAMLLHCGVMEFSDLLICDQCFRTDGKMATHPETELDLYSDLLQTWLLSSCSFIQQEKLIHHSKIAFHPMVARLQK